ncbi:MAG: flagellar motor switch protein FliN [Sedimentisphaerales bacterium]|nr:flagellar motor switch protein FliN [Sedimentisphaerales bacterium]
MADEENKNELSPEAELETLEQEVNDLAEEIAGTDEDATETSVESAQENASDASLDEDKSASAAEKNNPAGREDEGRSVSVPDLPDFSGMLQEAAASSIEMLNDVELDVKIELGRAELTVEEILNLTNGSVVELNKLAGDPVDVLVNEKLVARGEVLVVNDNFCVRINEIVPGVGERGAEPVVEQVIQPGIPQG